MKQPVPKITCSTEYISTTGYEPHTTTFLSLKVLEKFGIIGQVSSLHESLHFNANINSVAGKDRIENLLQRNGLE